jgi:Na+/H+-dicarboxylate symporter
MQAAPAAQRTRLTVQILTGMALGALVGIGINLLGFWPAAAAAHGFLLTYFAEGLFAIAGRAFIALLTVLVVPLVFVSLVNGTTALDDIRKLGRIGARTLGLYLLTTAMAISLALAAAVLVRPGAGFGLTTGIDYHATPAPPLVEVLVDIFPRNVVASMAAGNMLQIIVFAILLGIAITLAGDPGKRLLTLFADANAVVLKLVWVVMRIAPIGVFALLGRTFATQGLDAFAPLLKYFLLVIAVLLTHALVVYPLLLRLFARLPALPFLRKMRDVHVFAFSTATSNATIPISLHTVEHRLGADNSIAAFTIPLGATINMDGTAIMQGVATVFIAQAYGMGLQMSDYLVVVLIATLASIGTAGVPSVGLVMLSMVLTQVGLPVEGVALIIGIDRVLDMVRTAVNVTGDCVITCIVANGENALDRDRYRAPLDNGEQDGASTPSC